MTDIHSSITGVRDALMRVKLYHWPIMGTLTKDDTKKAQLLNTYFASVFTRGNTYNIPILTQHAAEPLAYIERTPDMAEKKLKKPKLIKSAGPDGQHQRVLLVIASTISLPLSLMNKVI